MDLVIKCYRLGKQRPALHETDVWNVFDDRSDFPSVSVCSLYWQRSRFPSTAAHLWPRAGRVLYICDVISIVFYDFPSSISFIDCNNALATTAANARNVTLLWARREKSPEVDGRDGRETMHMRTALLLNSIPVSHTDPLQVAHVLCDSTCN
jgi:hypothetical protein